MKVSFNNPNAFFFLALFMLIILVLAMILNSIFIRRLLIAIREKDLDSTNKFSRRLKYFILCQGISFIPSVLTSKILALIHHDVLVVIIYFAMSLTCYRSFIFIYIYGCTEGLKSKMEVIRYFATRENEQQLEQLEGDFEEECNKSFRSRFSSNDRKRNSEVFVNHISYKPEIN